MVCIPCIVIPFLLWVFHKYIRPVFLKFGWNPFGILGKANDKSPPDEKTKAEQNGVEKPHKDVVSNGIVNGEVKAGGPSKKDD